MVYSRSLPPLFWVRGRLARTVHYSFRQRHFPTGSSSRLFVRLTHSTPNMAATDAKIIFYTNHGCPFAHRAHITVSELHLPVEEVLIDLDIPRTPEYLAINPRGQVPTISYNGTIITESAIVAQFLADTYPSHLIAPSNTFEGALQRARVAFFVDTFFSKFQFPLFGALSAKSAKEEKETADHAVASLAKEIEPLLANAEPFFGGKAELTMAEVLTGSFVIRLFSCSKAGIYPAGLMESIHASAPKFYKWAEQVAKHPSVTNIYDEKVVVDGMRKRYPKQYTA